MNRRAVFLMVAVLAMCCIGASAYACEVCSATGCRESGGFGNELCYSVGNLCYMPPNFQCGHVIEIESVVRFPRGQVAGSIVVRKPLNPTREDALFITRSLHLLTINTLIHR